MLSFIFVQDFYRLFIYVLALEIQLSSRIPLTEVIPQYFVPVPSQDLDFKRYIFFLCLLLGTYTNIWEV